jgi:hypothetical protein
MKHIIALGRCTHFFVPTTRPDYQKTACGTSSQLGTSERRMVNCLRCRKTNAFQAAKQTDSQTAGWVRILRKRP